MNITQHRVDISNTARESRSCVSHCVSELPFTQACARKLDPTAELVWIDRALPVKCFYLQRLGANRRIHQRANRFFGMDTVLTKCSLARSMESLSALCAIARPNGLANTNTTADTTTADTTTATATATTANNHHQHHCMPRSWCFPRDCRTFEMCSKEKQQNKMWYIAKPDRGRCGRGIALFSNRADVMTAFRTGELSEVDKEKENQGSVGATTGTTIPLEQLDPVVVQEYIPDPLLFETTGCKFDLRIYVLVKSLTPLTVYVLDEGLVRVASTSYEAPTASNCLTATMHLTNSHINSKVKGVSGGSGSGGMGMGMGKEQKSDQEQQEQEEEEEGPLLKHCMSTTLKRISQQHNVPTQELWDRVCTSVATAVVAVYPSAALAHSKCFAPNRKEHDDRCFQLLGVDVLLDRQLKPWILEINNSPSLNLSTKADVAIKIPLVKSMLTKVFDYDVEDDATTAATTAQWSHEGFVPRFQPLNVAQLVCNESERLAVVAVQASVLDTYRKLCGWKSKSLRPVKATTPSKTIWKKVIDNGVALPDKVLCLDLFTQWVAKEAKLTASCSVLRVLEQVEGALV